MVKWLKRMRRRRRQISLLENVLSGPHTYITGTSENGSRIWWVDSSEDGALAGFRSLGGVYINEVRHVR
jgi:hypothetical protein